MVARPLAFSSRLPLSRVPTCRRVIFPRLVFSAVSVQSSSLRKERAYINYDSAGLGSCVPRAGPGWIPAPTRLPLFFGLSSGALTARAFGCVTDGP